MIAFLKKNGGVLVKSGGVLVKNAEGVLVIQWGRFGKKWGVLAVGRFDMYSFQLSVNQLIK